MLRDLHTVYCQYSIDLFQVISIAALKKNKFSIQYKSMISMR